MEPMAPSTRPFEREIPLRCEGDVLWASRSGLNAARRAGLTFADQFRLCGLIAEVSRCVLSQSARGVVVVRDESDETSARVRVLVTGRPAGLELSAEQWRAKWRIDDFDVTQDLQEARISAALEQPRR